MRSDMFKVIVERPRKWKDDGKRAARLRNDHEGPSMLGMRMGHGRPALNENLKPLRRYLHAQVGRPWAKVFSEICAHVDRRNTVQQHIHQHIDDFIATNVQWRDGGLVDLKRRSTFYLRDGGIPQRLYVDPKSGLIRINDSYRSWGEIKRERQREGEVRAAALRLVIDESRILLKLDDCWFLVNVAPLPEYMPRTVRVSGVMKRLWHADARFDVVLKRNTSSMSVADNHERQRLYGRCSLYAVAKRQISRREAMRFGVK